MPVVHGSGVCRGLKAPGEQLRGRLSSLNPQDCALRGPALPSGLVCLSVCLSVVVCLLLSVSCRSLLALAAGCTVVLKPAELTPLTALALAELADRSRRADGVLKERCARGMRQQSVRMRL